MYTPGAVIFCNLRPARSCITVACVPHSTSSIPVAAAVTEMQFPFLSIVTAICSPSVEVMSPGAISSPAESTMNPPSYILLLPV